MKKALPLILVSCILFSLCSCNLFNNPADYPVTIGNVVIGEKPATVVCLSESAADIIIACGYSTMISARSEDCDQNSISLIPSIGTSSAPDIEAIVGLECDVVISDDKLTADDKKKLEQSGIKVLALTNATTRDELTRMYSNISAVFEGNTTGRANGEKKIENIFSSIDELNRQIPDSQIVTTACYIYDVDGDDVKLVTGDSFASNLIEYTKTTNVGAGAINSTLDATTLKMQNPKFIFCAPGVKQKLENHEILSKLYALNEGNIFELEPSAMQRQGNTILSTVEFMVVSMYPELTGDHSESSDSDTSDTDSMTDSDIASDTDTSSDGSESDTDNSDSEESSDTDEEATDVSSTSSQDGTRYYRVKSDDGLSLRSTPEKTDNIIGSLMDQQRIELVEDLGNGWFRVKTEDGNEGYCSSEFLVKDNGQ